MDEREFLKMLELMTEEEKQMLLQIALRLVGRP